MADMNEVLARADQNLDSSLERLFELIRIKSISTDPQYASECRRTAERLAAMLTDLGFRASARETGGNPVVVAHDDSAGPDAPRALFYGHYDVQPVDPLDLWDNDPFDPAIRTAADGHKIITGRGTSDDKGQLLTFVEAVRAYKEIVGKPPIRLTLLFEGEEESGSPSLPPFLKTNAEELKADFAMICDTGMWDPDTPAVTASLRGSVSDEVVIHAADRDLHSGLYGGAAANPIHVLAHILADLHDDTGAVTLAGFYDGVRELPADIKKAWLELEKTWPGYLSDIGLSILSGEKGRSFLELTWARPTCEITGITGGYTGDGFKTVIPAQAMAKVSFRLVPGQDPDRIRESFRSYVTSRLPGDCRATFKAYGAAPASQLAYDSPLLLCAQKALTAEWPNPALAIGSGGSIPVVNDFQTILGMDSLMVGYSLADDRVHSPNEKYDLQCFHKGIRSWIRVLDAISTLN